MLTRNNFLYAGWAAILAGLVWMGLALLVISGRDLFSGTILDYLGIFSALLMVIVGFAMYQQGGRSKVGIAAFTLGSASLAVSSLLYAIAFNPENGEAFALFLLGTIVQGIGLAVLGYRFRSLEGSIGWGTSLLVLGILLVLVFPIWFILQDGLGLNFLDRYGDLAWGSIMTVQAVSWIILTRLTFTRKQEVEHQAFKPSEMDKANQP